MGGWCHPDVPLQDLLKLIKGFVDILILGSGYQSSGRFAHWDPENIRKVFQWGIFFENVFGNLDNYQDSVGELDMVMSKLASDPHFPQGLTHISSADLCRARSFILEHLIHTLPIRGTHLRSVLTATIEMDLDELQKTENDYLPVYIDKLILQDTTMRPVANKEGLMDNSSIRCADNVPCLKAKSSTGIDFSTIAIQEIMKRQVAVSCFSSIDTGMDILAKIVTRDNSKEFDDNLLQEPQKLPTAHTIEEQLLDSIRWNHWRTRNLSYLLDRRTIRLVAGASMIFSSPRVQWVHVFERLDMSGEADTDLFEKIELLFVGCISSRWNCLVEHFMSISHQCLPISTIYDRVHNLMVGRFQNSEFEVEMKNSKKQGILEYLEVKLSNQLHLLWKQSPALTAMSLPSWSYLFEVYVSELASQFKGKTTKIRCCSCIEDGKEHRDSLFQVRLLRGFGASTSFMSLAPAECAVLKLLENFCLMSDLKKLQTCRWGTRIYCSGTAVGIAGGQRRRCPSLLKQLMWRLKSEWKQALRRQRSTGKQYGYDPQTYSQNFDDGFVYDHLSPLAP